MQLPNRFIWKQKSFENINNLSTEYCKETFQFQKVNIFPQCYLTKENLQLSFKTGLNAKDKNKEKRKDNKEVEKSQILIFNIIVRVFFPLFHFTIKQKFYFDLILFFPTKDWPLIQKSHDLPSSNKKQ